MPALHNPRHEQFAQLVATGKTPAESYVGVGYAKKAAYTCGPRLLKTTSVQARVKELQQTVATAAVTRAVLDHEFVLRELMDNALKAKQDREWSASNRALELLGKELGMFGPPNFQWDGDIATLTDHQLDQVCCHLAKAARNAHQTKIEETRVYDVEPAASEEESSDAVPAQDGW